MGGPFLDYYLGLMVYKIEIQNDGALKLYTFFAPPRFEPQSSRPQASMLPLCYADSPELNFYVFLHQIEIKFCP
jgi:hypothetical protein